MSEVEKHRMLIEHLPDAYAYYQVVTDSEGKPEEYVFLDVNRAFEEMFNLPRSAVMGKKVTAILPEIKGYPFDWISAFGQVALKGESVNFQQYFEPTDCWYDVIACSDSPGYFALVFRDITELKRAEEVLKESEQHYRLLVEHAGEAIVVVQDGIVKYANPATVQAFGYSEEKLRSEPFIEFLHPEERNLAIEEYTKALSGSTVTPNYTLRVITGKGSIKWIEFNGVQIEWENRPSILGFARDITKNKQAEAALRKSEEKYRLLAENVSDVIWTTDLNLNYTYISPSAEHISGYTVEEIMSLGIKEILKPSSLERALQVVREELELEASGDADPNRTRIVELEQYRKDGSTVWVEVKASILHDQERRPTGILGITRDIDDRKRAEEKLQEEHHLRMNLLDNIPGCIALILQKETRQIVASNKAAHETGAVPGEKCYKTCAKRDDECPFCLAPALWATGELKEIEVKYQDKWCFGIWAPLSKELYVHYIFDISDRKLAEQKLSDYTLELEQLYRQLDTELDKARQVHERTLPTVLPTVEGISFAAHYQPAQKMGGDLYDVIHRDNKLIFYLSDVSGHGLDGTMLSFFIKEAIDSYINLKPDAISPHQLLKHLASQYGRENYDEELFFCIFIAVLDLETLELSYCGAGFQEKMLLRLGNGDRLALAATGMFITSYLPTEMLTLKDQSIVITPGSTIFLTTDGLTEQRAQGVYYRDRLPDIFYANAQLPPDQVARAVLEDFRQFNNGSLQGKDDITFLVLQIACQGTVL